MVLPTRTLCAPLFVFHGCFHSVLPALLVRNINQRRVFLRAQKQTLTKDGLGSRAAVSYELAGRRESDDGQSEGFSRHATPILGRLAGTMGSNSE